MTAQVAPAEVGFHDERASRSRRPLRPENDPFYRPPTGFASFAPGTILRSRKINLALAGLIPQRVSAWQLLFRSTDLNGAPEASVTTVILPRNADSSTMPLLSYQCAIDAISSSCQPSHSLQAGARLVTAPPQFELLLVMGAVARGWAVSIPDHEGTGGHWGAPREPGYRILDGLRAALAFTPLGLRPDTQIGLWGYSGGGLATSWAAEMAVDYAPELDIVGAALGSPVGDPGSAYIRLNGTIFAGLPSLVISGLRRVYPELDRIIRTHATLDAQARMRSIEHMGTVTAAVTLARFDVGDVIDIPMADLLAQPEMVKVFEDIQVGTVAPNMPLLVTQAVHDEVIALDDVDGQVHRYRSGGAHVTYVRDKLSEHAILHPLGTPMVLAWLADRFAGRPATAATTKTVWSVTQLVSPLQILEMVEVAAKVMLGLPPNLTTRLLRRWQ